MPYATLRFVHLGWRVIRLEPTPAAGPQEQGRSQSLHRPARGRRRSPQLLRGPERGQGGDRRGSRSTRKGASSCAAWCASSAGGRVLHQHLAGPPPRARLRLRDAAPGARGAGVVRDLGHGHRARRGAGLRPGGAGAVRLHGPHGPGRRAAAAVRAADHRSQGRRRGVRAGAARADGARRDRQRQGRSTSRWRTAPCRGSTPSCRCSTWAARPKSCGARATSTASSSRSTPTPRPTASCTWRIGSDAQWARFVKQPMFAELDDPRYHTNEGRRAQQGRAARGDRATSRAGTRRPRSPRRSRPPPSRIRPSRRSSRWRACPSWPRLRSARSRPTAGSCGCHRRPCRRPISRRSVGELPFAPSYGEHTDAVLEEVGLGAADIAALRAEGVVA